MNKLIKFGNTIAAFFIIILTLFAVYIPSFELVENIQDYLVHILFLLIASGLIGLIINNRTILFTSFLCAGLLAIFLKNASNSELKNPNINNEHKIAVAHMNLSLITDVEVVKRIIDQPDIDVISFVEYTPDWAAIIPQLAAEKFPFSFKDVRIDLYGKAIYSRNKIENAKIFNFQDIPNIETEIVKDGQIFTIFLTYMTPALDLMSKSKAKQQFTILEEHLKNVNGNLIIAGEFNQVYWSHDIIAFRNKTGLLNSRRNVNPSSFKMPYDHIFYDPTLECYKFEDINDDTNNHIGCRGYYQIKKKLSKYLKTMR